VFNALTAGSGRIDCLPLLCLVFIVHDQSQITKRAHRRESID
jgi:hypothetical protein